MLVHGLVSDEAPLTPSTERGRSDTLRYQFETVSRMSEHEQEIVRELLDAVIVKNQVPGRWTGSTSRKRMSASPRRTARVEAKDFS